MRSHVDSHVTDVGTDVAMDMAYGFMNWSGKFLHSLALSKPNIFL